MTKPHAVAAIYEGRRCGFRLVYEKHLISADIWGDWNVQVARRYVKGFAQILEQINDKHWAIMMDVSKLSAGTQDAQEEVSQTYGMAIKKGCVLDIYYGANPVAIFQIEQNRKSSGIKSELVHFDTKEQALSHFERAFSKAK